jgi:hypothetical protein
MRMIGEYVYVVSVFPETFNFFKLIDQTRLNHNIYLISCIGVIVNTTLEKCLLAVHSHE